MTEENLAQKAVMKLPSKITGFASREEIVAFGKRIKTMLPVAKDLSDAHAYALAQYALSTDSNPWRGEIYAWEDWKGELYLSEGYKLLVRWAKRQCEYTEKYESTSEGCREGDIGFKCSILRNDHLAMMKAFVEMGAKFDEAFDLAATSAVGIVRKEEMFFQQDIKNKQGQVFHHKGDPVDPPKGWNWEQRAKIRALKNTINQAFGTPSPRELAAESWRVGNIVTQPEDWEDITPNMTIPEREAIAAYNAERRISKDQEPDLVDARQATEELFEL